MTKTPLSIPSVKLKSCLFLTGWILAYTATLYFFMHWNWQICIADSVISNGLLAGGCVVLSNMLGYYQPKKDKSLFLLLLVVALSVIVVLVSKYTLTYLFVADIHYLRFLQLSTPFKGMLSFLCLSWCVLVHVLWYRLEEQTASQDRLLATQNLAKEAELDKLRHQLQPHFLFNSLNSVYALTIVNPHDAGKMITKLSSFLRGTLKRDDEVWVSVKEEIEYMQLYLDIEKVRFSHRLDVVIDVDANVDGLTLPGTLLQPIVENAIKFGLYNTSVAVTIAISVKMDGNYLLVSVTNPFDPEMSAVSGTGFGLNAIKRRLYLLFADNSLLSTKTTASNLFITTIKIPQKNESNID